SDLSPPSEVENPDGWNMRLENVRFSKLENGDEAIQFVMQVKSQRGPGFEIWLEDAEGTALRWSGGSALKYDGVVCFQLRLEWEGQALDLADGPYGMTVAFREPDADEPVVAQSLDVAGTPPRLQGGPPAAPSEVAQELLGCPRSVI
ncbi:MAG: hypothetical protein WED87_03450, partial [Dehalococcoidia bacterium]